MRISLRLKLMGATVLLLIFILALFGILQTRLVTTEISQQTERLRTLRSEQARIVGLRTVTSITASSRFAIAENDFSVLNELIGPIVKESEGTDLPILQAAITDADALVLASATAPGAKAVPKKLDKSSLKELKTPAVDVSVSGEGVPDKVVVTAPVVDGQETRWGYVHFVYDLVGLRADLVEIERQGDERRQQIFQRGLLIGGLVVLLGVVIAILQALAITRPLEALSRSASRIAEGDIETRVAVRTRDEIGDMAQNFNHMAERIGELLVETANKTALERELEVARIIQETLLPPRGEVRQGPLSLSGFLESASLCGGDFWTYAPLDDGRVLVCIGDVTGHGVPSAMITAACKSGLDTLRSVKRGRLDVSMILDELNKTIYEAARRKFAMTFFAAIVDPASHTMDIANAGHNFPILVRQQNGRAKARALVARGNRLGDQRDSHYGAGQERLQAGDLLCLYTDGITEYLNGDGEMFGERRLRRLLCQHAQKSPDAIISEVLGALNQFAGQSVQEDDITMVVARYG